MREQEKTEIMVSICAVAFQHEKYIAQCLDHFLSQKVNFRYEILVHDDASTDGTADIIRDYAKRYPDIVKPLIQKENQYSKGITNLSGAFNFPRAQGKYIALSDCDDFWCDDYKLQKQVDYMEAHPDCVFCFHAAQVVGEDGSFVNGALMRPYRKSRRVLPQELVDKAGGYPFASYLFRRELVTELPAYYRDCPVGDRPLELMAAAAGEAYYFDEAMSVYRFNVGGSWTSQMKSGDYVEKQNVYAKRMQETYRAFDRATDGRFHEEAVRASKRIYFLTRVNLRDWKEIYSRKNRRFLRELGLRDRFFFRFERHLPGVYRLAQHWYHRA